MNVKSSVVALTENIHWVGYRDWTVRDFHSYHTSRGSTYNSYLISDQKKVLVDTVKAPYVSHLLSNINAVLGEEKLDYIILNHGEPDHAGSISELVRQFPQAVLVCTDRCRKILGRYHDTGEWNFSIVKSGDRLEIGERVLEFLETPMVHWPDSMFTYSARDRILFSMDAFGQHFVSSGRFDDEVDLTEVMQEAKKYYANILMLYGKQIKRVLNQAAEYDIGLIAPSHGIIWRRHVDRILERYRDWVDLKVKARVLVLYDSMWESTRIMAQSLIRGVMEKGVEAKLIWVRSSGLTEIATEVLDSSVLAIGSATLNKGMMPAMGAVLTYLKGLEPAGKKVQIFSSTGWGKGAAEAMTEQLRDSKMEIIGEPLKVFWRPDDKELEKCVRAGYQLADMARQAVRDQA